MIAPLAFLLSLPFTPGLQQAARPLSSRTTPAPIVVATGCASSIRDQANPGACIEASTVPVLGRIFPLSTSLFVSSVGDVGIGTTSPARKLDVAGTARLSDTLTLAPQGDQALDVSTGSIYKGGALFIHTKGGGANNLAVGRYALASNTSGVMNTAIGATALSNNTGSYNVGIGTGALNAGDGNYNVAVGTGALFSNTGSYNTGIGHSALGEGSGNNNIAIGYYAGSYTRGNSNILIGHRGVMFENNTIRIGSSTQARAFLAGVRGVLTANANAIPVLVDSAGQLGTISSSRRFKDEIRDMGELTERLLALRPVVFRYKPEVQNGERPLEYGLIAEEVAEVFSELVVNDEEGRPFTVKYHLLSSMLLNELKKLHDAGVEHARELEELRSEVTRLRRLETRLAAVEARGG
jgi:hypothetical protein